MGHPSRMNEGNDERGHFCRQARPRFFHVGGKFAYRAFHLRGILQGGKESLSVAVIGKLLNRLTLRTRAC